MKYLIHIQYSVFINKSREIVWDFTQDYSKRPAWDIAVKEALVLDDSEEKSILIKGSGFSAWFVYKLFRRPEKTTLVMTDVQSAFIESGGGSWCYESKGEGAIWTQSNSIVLKKSMLAGFFSPLIRFALMYQLRKAMDKAKWQIENSNP